MNDSRQMVLGIGTHTSLGELRDAESTHEWLHKGKVEIRSRTHQHLAVKGANAIIIGARITDFGHIPISMNEASGMVV